MSTFPINKLSTILTLSLIALGILLAPKAAGATEANDAIATTEQLQSVYSRDRTDWPWAVGGEYTDAGQTSYIEPQTSFSDRIYPISNQRLNETLELNDVGDPGTREVGRMQLIRF